MINKENRRLAQERNYKIFQFRGYAKRVVGMIPDDIWNKLNKVDKNILINAEFTFNKVIELMDKTTNCKHWYDEENICILCNHKKYSRDGKGRRLIK